MAWPLRKRINLKEITYFWFRFKTVFKEDFFNLNNESWRFQWNILNLLDLINKWKALFYYIIAVDATMIERLYPHVEFLKTIKINQTSKMLSESNFHDTSSNKHFIWLRIQFIVRIKVNILEDFL